MENVGLHLIDGTPQSFLDCVHILHFHLRVDDLVSDDVLQGFCPLDDTHLLDIQHTQQKSTGIKMLQSQFVGLTPVSSQKYFKMIR